MVADSCSNLYANLSSHEKRSMDGGTGSKMVANIFWLHLEFGLVVWHGFGLPTSSMLFMIEADDGLMLYA